MCFSKQCFTLYDFFNSGSKFFVEFAIVSIRCQKMIISRCSLSVLFIFKVEFPVYRFVSTPSTTTLSIMKVFLVHINL